MFEVRQNPKYKRYSDVVYDNGKTYMCRLLSNTLAYDNFTRNPIVVIDRKIYELKENGIKHIKNVVVYKNRAYINYEDEYAIFKRAMGYNRWVDELKEGDGFIIPIYLGDKMSGIDRGDYAKCCTVTRDNYKQVMDATNTKLETLNTRQLLSRGLLY